MSMSGKAGDSLGVQAMEVGLKLLDPLVAAGAPLNLKTIAEAVGFPPPKAHRYLVSLIRARLVEQDEITGRYGLGPLAIGLGLTALGMIDKDRLGRIAVSDLRMETDHTACLAVWGTGGPTIAAVETSASAGAVFLAMRIGSVLSLLRSATGRVFLAHMPRDIVAPCLEAERATDRISAKKIESLIADTRRLGFGAVDEILNPGVSAVSAPVFDHDGNLLYAITSVGQTAHFDTSPESRVVRLLLEKTRAVSKRLGCTDAILDEIQSSGREKR